MGRLLTRMTLGRSTAQVRHVTPVPPGSAEGLVARVYEQMERDLGMQAAPVMLHSPAPGPLAACWLLLRETLLAADPADRAAAEAVAAGVSLANSCPYCVDVHSMVIGGLGFGRDAVAIRRGDLTAVADPRLRDLSTWAWASGRRGGAAGDTPSPPPMSWAAPWAASPVAPAPAAPAAPADTPPAAPLASLSPERAAGMAGVAVASHYITRMVNVFLGESLLPLALSASARSRFMALIGRVAASRARRPPVAGLSLGLVPYAPLPPDLSWARPAETVAGAFGRAYAVVDGAAVRSVTEPVRDAVLETLAAWDGLPPGPESAWIDKPLSLLPLEERAQGRLALLTAMASHRVPPSLMAACRDELGGGGEADRTLVELTAWASLTAARRVGEWIGAGVPR
ncbi:alkylhydroperoxidase AhpD family core domain-containing protein [Sinosporangium album]|uniref:Alkylhydroperoxidase AhpD family core domain-containing protein n=1 Tax=Sinosporangium album TaxID=504805 RepID=A0A1G8C8Z6_9ACTN|nr:carboxymuconolactone decarboxylase family protein [Sinosporangium album]SDH41783.1 alkylhydroperoxidase AhpD family core domain-containing protein [Sinosporangium album]